MGRTLPLAAALLAALALPAPVGARKFQMSGNWLMRNGAIFLPLQYAATAMGTGGNMTHVSVGNLTEALGYPNGPIPGAGGVTATGSAPASLRVPAHRFVQDAMFGLALSGFLSIVQITTNIGIDAPFAAATLAPGAGPGSFTWCPGDPACVDGPGTMLASDPPQGMGPRPGRVIYRGGPNHFGGVMQLGLARGGVNTFRAAGTPTNWMGHVRVWGSGSTLRKLAPGGGAADAPAMERKYLAAGFLTQPLTFMDGSLIANPGPKLTTMLGLTNTSTGPTLSFALGTTPMGFKFGHFTSHYGFPHTTGTAIGQQTSGSNGDDFFTFMGYDERTALGAGAIQTVAGGLSFHTTQTGVSPYASMHRVRMTLGAPIPSLSPGGAAAAGALLLVAAGYALRRRGTNVSSE